MIRNFFRDSLVYTIPAFISRGLAFFLIPVYTRVLSPGDFGSLDLLMAFVSLVGFTVAMEVSQGVARFHAGADSNSEKSTYFSTAFWFTFICHSIFLMLSLLVEESIAPLIMGGDGMEGVFRLGACFIWINALFGLIQNQLRWQLQSRRYAIVSLVMSAVTAASSVMLTTIGGYALGGVLVGMILGSASGCILGMIWLRESLKFEVSLVHLRAMLSYSAPLVFSSTAVWVSLYLDRIMIQQMLTTNDVGLYGFGYRIASIGGLVLIGFQSALTPHVISAHRNHETPQHVAVIFRAYLSTALVLYAFISLFAEYLILPLAPSSYHPGMKVVAFLMPAIIVSNSYIFFPGFDISMRTRFYIVMNVGGAIINLLLNLLLIPAVGYQGAAIATFISSVCALAFLVAVSQRLYYIPIPWRTVTAGCFFGICAVVFANVNTCPYSTKWMINLVAFGAFICGMFLSRLITRRDLMEGIALLSGMFRNRS